MKAVLNRIDRRMEPRFPDPETIRRRAEQIRRGWSTEERKQRAELARRYLDRLSHQIDL